MIKYIKKLLRNTIFQEFYNVIIQKKERKKLITTYIADFANFNKSYDLKRFENNEPNFPVMDDRTGTIEIEPHYTYHPAWAARILAKTKPNKHIDISSILYFSTMVSAFIPSIFYDYRPAKVILEGLETKQADLTKLPFANNSIESLSCMHTIEHIGLGRYGDEIDYNGDLKAIKELVRVLANNGDLLIVTPIGKPKIAFNAHRIYAYNQIIEYFSDLKLMEFSLIPDNFEDVGIITNATEQQSDAQCWGCGCFWFKKTTDDLH